MPSGRIEGHHFFCERDLLLKASIYRIEYLLDASRAERLRHCKSRLDGCNPRLRLTPDTVCGAGHAATPVAHVVISDLDGLNAAFAQLIANTP